MRISRLRLNVKNIERSFREVDRSINEALRNAQAREAEAEFDPPSLPQTYAGRVAATPELADIYLSVNTRLGKDEVLVRPIEGAPTGLTEVFEHPHPKEALLKVYDHTLALVQDKFPETSVYRVSVENLTRARREVVENSSSKEEIEQRVGSGLVEEILIQAAEEFRLAEIMAENKVWEPLEEHPKPDQWVAHAVKTHHTE